MKLIHTADVHLDACFATAGVLHSSAHVFGNRRRQSLRDVFDAIVRRAGEWPADTLLIAGDLFEQERATRDTIAFLRAEFASIAHVPVFIAPGNHDPFVSNSPYATEAWGDNVTIFSTPAWTSHTLDGTPLTCHGFGFDGPDISSNPFGTLRVPDDGRVHVAVAHGSEQGHQPPDKGLYAPFEAKAAATDGLAYLALGHFHSMLHIENDSHTCMYYSGAPEGHSFKELGPHHYIEVELDTGGAPATATVNPVLSSRVVYQTSTIDCSRFDSAQEAISAIRSLADDGTVARIARVTLTGTTPAAIEDQLSSIHDAVAGEFEYLDIIDDLDATEDYDELEREATSLGAFLAKMNDEILNTSDEARLRMLERAREVGLAAYRGRELPVRGMEDPGA